MSIDESIRTLVIDERVKVDCNIKGGIEATIALRGCPVQQVEQHAFVYRIPKSLTQGRNITAALSIAFTGSQTTVPFGYSGNEIDNASNKMLNSLKSIPYESDARCNLIGIQTRARRTP